MTFDESYKAFCAGYAAAVQDIEMGNIEVPDRVWYAYGEWLAEGML